MVNNAHIHGVDGKKENHPPPFRVGSTDEDCITHPKGWGTGYKFLFLTIPQWAVIVTGALVFGCLTIGGIHAQPGSETDPVVSLSYLDTALAMSPIVLEGGEDIRVAGGRGLSLIEGTCRLSPPDGDRSWILDISAGEVLHGEVDMQEGHYYLPLSENTDTVEFTLLAWQTSTVAIQGGAGR